MIFELLIIDAFLKLFMDHYISKSTNRRCEMSVIVKTQTKMTFICIQAASIYSEFLNLYGFQ
jgi:hypothetical protein